MLQGLLYKNCIYFHNRYESFNCHQYLHYIPQPVCQLDLFYNFHSLNILSRTSHDLSHSHSQLLGSQVNLLQHFLCQSTLYIYICIYYCSKVVYYYKHLHLQELTKYLRLTLVFMWNGAQREKFSFYFWRVFFWY